MTKKEQEEVKKTNKKIMEVYFESGKREGKKEALKWLLSFLQV